MANIPRARYDGGVYFIRSFLSNRLADLGRFVTTFQPLLPRATSKLISILLTPGLPMAA